MLKPANERARILAVKGGDESPSVEAAEVYREWHDRMLNLGGAPIHKAEDDSSNAGGTMQSKGLDRPPITVVTFEC